MSKLSDDVAKKLKDTKESIQFLTDHIVEVDADKEAFMILVLKKLIGI